jgi:hypothetical protein
LTVLFIVQRKCVKAKAVFCENSDFGKRLPSTSALHVKTGMPCFQSDELHHRRDSKSLVGTRNAVANVRIEPMVGVRGFRFHPRAHRKKTKPHRARPQLLLQKI